MDILDASGFQSVTRYAPVRIALLGMVRAFFGLLVAGMGGLALWVASAGEMTPKQPGDMPAWWMVLVGAGLSLVGLMILAGGLGRVLSAFASDCYFKAGREGIAVRLPRQRSFGRFSIEEHRMKWEDIEQITPRTIRVNMIPVAWELQIRQYGGKEITIKRYYFSASVKRMSEELAAIAARTA